MHPPREAIILEDPIVAFYERILDLKSDEIKVSFDSHFIELSPTDGYFRFFLLLSYKFVKFLRLLGKEMEIDDISDLLKNSLLQKFNVAFSLLFSG